MKADTCSNSKYEDYMTAMGSFIGSFGIEHPGVISKDVRNSMLSTVGSGDNHGPHFKLTRLANQHTVNPGNLHPIGKESCPVSPANSSRDEECNLNSWDL